MVTARHLRADPVAARAGYHAISTCAIHRVAMAAITSASRAGLAWSGVHVVVVGWIFGGVRCSAIVKFAELSCELY